MEITFPSGGVTLTVGLDRTVLGIPYPKLAIPDDIKPPTQKQIAHVKDLQKQFVKHLHHIRQVIENSHYPHVLVPTKSKDFKRYNVLTEDKQLLCTFALGFNFATGMINVEFNPTRLTKNDIWGHLNNFLGLCFNHHYDELYARGVVSHAEFYVDVPVCADNLVLIDYRKRAYTLHEGTTYLGKRTSPESVTMYDKAKQLKQDGTLVRIEARISQRKTGFKGLVESSIANPL
jgi:hypothetical protein